MIGVSVNADLVQTGLLCHKRGDGLDDHTAHRHPGILLHARCRLAFAWPFMVSSAARSCRALQRSFTLLLLARLLFWLLLCCTLKLPSFSPHPPVFTLSFLCLACLLAHLTCNIITHSLSRHTTKLASILTRISFVTSDTDRDTNVYISAATPSHPPPPLGRTAHSRPTRPPCISLRSSHSTIQGQTSPPPRRARHSQTQLQTSRS
jgi:hypothetical protein